MFKDINVQTVIEKSVIHMSDEILNKLEKALDIKIRMKCVFDYEEQSNINFSILYYNLWFSVYDQIIIEKPEGDFEDYINVREEMIEDYTTPYLSFSFFYFEELHKNIHLFTKEEQLLWMDKMEGLFSKDIGNMFINYNFYINQYLLEGDVVKETIFDEKLKYTFTGLMDWDENNFTHIIRDYKQIENIINFIKSYFQFYEELRSEIKKKEASSNVSVLTLGNKKDVHNAAIRKAT